MEHLHKMCYWSKNTTQKLSENPQYQFLRLLAYYIGED